jgi:hypothetical protein
MAIVRVSGSRIVTPGGPTALSAPKGNIVLNAESISVTGNLNVANTLSAYHDVVVIGGISVNENTLTNYYTTSSISIKTGAPNVQNPTGINETFTDSSGTVRVYPDGGVYDTSTNRILGMVYVPGGVGIEKDLNVGGFIYGRVAKSTTSTQLLITATNEDRVFYPVFTDNLRPGDSTVTNYGSYLFGDNTGTEYVGLTYNPYRGILGTEKLIVWSSQTAYNTTSASAIFKGGVGIVKDTVMGGNLTVGGDSTVTNVYASTGSLYTIGNTDTTFLSAYIENIYTKVIESTQGGIRIAPQGGGADGYPTTDVFGDLRVAGKRPIGTAPVVTNVLWVTMDGDDTNDGRAEDPSRACRTVTGATRSPYFQPGTQIRVHAGHYLEDNPVELKPYTSVVGSDLRTTSVEPINKTQDLFHVQSGCYIAQMQMTNGRSGLLEGSYRSDLNRGAYCTAFPPLTGDARIDLFHSPYIQNCTNQSGPWLKDGTMFQPSGTVQVPSAVGNATWDANTTTLMITMTTGTPARGMVINHGVQHPTYFNARTLMLANKQFLQEQVVTYVDQIFNRGTFTYNTETCARDAGYVIDAVYYDTALGTNYNAVTAGNAYRRGNASSQLVVNDELIQTIGAFEYLRKNSETIVNSDATALSRSNAAYNEISDILANNTPNALVFPVPAGGAPTKTAAKNQLVANKSFIQQEVVSWIQTQIDSNSSPFSTNFHYTTSTCYRDVGYIVDALCYDILYGGDSASLTCARAYFSFAVSQIPNEVNQTIAAYQHLIDVVQNIVIGNQYPASVGNTRTQSRALPYASSTEAQRANTLLQYIITAINDGNLDGLPAPTYPSISWASQGIQDAASALASAKSTLISGMITYINNNYAQFSFDTIKCARDTRLIIEGLATDLLYASTSESIFSGIQYWNQSGYTGDILRELSTTTAAINYLATIASNAATNAGGGAQGTQVTKLFNTVTNILTYGTVGITDIIVSNGLPSNDTNVKAAYDALIAQIPTFQQLVIGWIAANNPTFVYNTSTCARDVGYIVESVAFDLLHGGNKQSIKSGVYYFNYTDESTLAATNEIPATTAAYNFIKSIIPQILKGQPILNPQQSPVINPQIISPYPAATEYEVASVQNNIDVITSIIRNGPTAVDAKIPMNLTRDNNQEVTNAYNLLLANKNFIVSETVAYINNTITHFDYNRAKCFRDVGILVENVSYDITFGGNEKSVQSGLAYYNGTISAISGQETQTVSAIDYLNYLCKKIVKNQVAPNLLGNRSTYQQVINIVLTGGEEVTKSLDNSFNIITNIILDGPTVAPTIYVSPGPDQAYVSAEILMQANRQFIQQQTINYINYNLSGRQFPYSKLKCERDTGLVIDAIALDLKYPTPGHSQSTFAGLQYWNQNGYTGQIVSEINQTIDAVTYLKDLSVKVIQNITPADDLIPRYQDIVPQVLDFEPATSSEASLISTDFDVILTILGGDYLGWTDRIIPNGKDESRFVSVYNATRILQASKSYLAAEVNAYITATNAAFTYDAATCTRDIGYIIDSICFDLVHGGNRQAVQSGLYYYSLNGLETVIPGEQTVTGDAFNYLGTIAGLVVRNQTVDPLQSSSTQTFLTNIGTVVEAGKILTSINTITNILLNGPGVAADKSPISLTKDATNTVDYAYQLLYANKQFLTDQVIAYIERTYNPNAFQYNERLCYRDTGLIVDAVSQDLLLGGNSKSVEAGVAYWNFGYNHVAGQETTTTLALNYARDVALLCAANLPVPVITGTTISQVINPYFQYGGDYMPQQAIRRNFHIITEIIEKGPLMAPPVYQGGGIFAATGQLADDVRNPPKITSVTTTLITGTYVIGLNTATIGFGDNAPIYMGTVQTFPLNDNQVEELSYEYTGNRNTYNLRKIDPIGSMGGSLVDGAVISDKSPINSFVYDAFTQVNQGGHGVKITRNGYAQLVSVFSIFCSVGVQVTDGGIASIVNSNANFGDICLLAKGYGKRAFSGTIYNPPYRAYPKSPGPDGFDQYYPNGYWPNNAQIEVFVPDLADRPHISLIMEIIPEDGHTNEQNLPGFLNADVNTGTITTGSITVTGIITDGISIGNYVYIRDLENHTTGTNGLLYANTGTYVTDLGYQSVTFNQPLTSGGGDPANNNYFNLYFCGNAYYTVLSSTIADNPRNTGTNILSYYNTTTDQVAAHVDAIKYLNTLTDLVVNNTPVRGNVSGALYQDMLTYSPVEQAFSPLVSGGIGAVPFIDLRFGEMNHIIGDATSSAEAESFYPQSLRTKTGTVPPGAGSAITLIEQNFEFLAAEVTAYVKVTHSNVTFNYDKDLCKRDAGYIIDGVTYDAALGTNYNAVTCGIAYRRGITSSQIVINEELAQTVAAYNFLKTEGETLMSASPTAVTRSDAAFNELNDIIAGMSPAAIVFPDPVGGNPTQINAKDLMVSNKLFIQQEVVSWIQTQIDSGTPPFDNFTYNSGTCYRDVGYIVDGLCYDVLYGGNSGSINNASAYFSFGVSQIPGEIDATVAAYNYMRSLVQTVIQGNPVTASPGNNISQQYGSVAGQSEVDTVGSLLSITIDAIQNGTLDYLPSVVYPDITWADQDVQDAVGVLQTNKLTLIDMMVTYIDATFSQFNYDEAKCKRDVKLILQRLIYDLESGGRYNSVYVGLSYWSRDGTHHIVQLGENVRRTDLFPDGCTVNFYQRSYISASGYVFEYVGAGTNYGALPQVGYADPVQGKETVQLDGGKVFFTSTDQNGDFRIGPGLVISQATGVLSGRTFTKSLFANMTPFILAIEGGGA